MFENIFYHLNDGEWRTYEKNGYGFNGKYSFCCWKS